MDGRTRDKHGFVRYSALLPDDDQPADKATAGPSQPVGGQSATAQAQPPGKTAASDATDQPGGSGETVSVEIGGGSADRQMVEHMRKNLINDRSRDGIDTRLFPLTTKEQANYGFELVGRERMNGRDVFHVVFRPREKQDFGWRGDAYIDAAAYEPVLVTTGMARKIPFAVRTFLGTNLPGLGFTVTYAPQPDGVWFPVSFSTEFNIEVLFFFRRTILIDAQNVDFEKTHVTSRIVGDAAPLDPDKP